MACRKTSVCAHTLVKRAQSLCLLINCDSHRSNLWKVGAFIKPGEQFTLNRRITDNDVSHSTTHNAEPKCKHKHWHKAHNKKNSYHSVIAHSMNIHRCTERHYACWWKGNNETQPQIRNISRAWTCKCIESFGMMFSNTIWWMNIIMICDSPLIIFNVFIYLEICTCHWMKRFLRDVNRQPRCGGGRGCEACLKWNSKM